MTRPFNKRIISHSNELFYKPAGIKLAGMEVVNINADEYEALRLADFENMSQEEAGRHMGVSRQTFGRIIENARKKTADALINGKAIGISKTGPVIINEQHYYCKDCGYEEIDAKAYTSNCPQCNEPLIAGDKTGAGRRGKRHMGRGRK